MVNCLVMDASASLLNRARVWWMCVVVFGAIFGAEICRGAAVPPQGGRGIMALPAVWQDDQGQFVRLAQWAGEPVIITMAYGTCRKVCSTSLRRMEEVQALADAAGQNLQFVVVSLDPKADTPEDWRAFRRVHRLERGNWHFIRGTPKDTRTLASLLGIGYWLYDDHVVHDFRVLRLGLHGEIEAMLTLASDAPSELVTVKPR